MTHNVDAFLSALARDMDWTLIDAIPATLKAAIDDAVKAGGTRAEILARVRRAAAGNGPLTVAACQAYMDELMPRPAPP